MAIVVGALILGVICAIAAALVFREALRMQELTPDDVRRILDFQIEYFKAAGVARNGSTSTPPGPVVVGEVELVDHILAKCAATGEAYLPEQVHAVVECQVTYLRAIGMVGRPAGDDGPGPDVPRSGR